VSNTTPESFCASRTLRSSTKIQLSYCACGKRKGKSAIVNWSFGRGESNPVCGPIVWLWLHKTQRYPTPRPSYLVGSKICELARKFSSGPGKNHSDGPRIRTRGIESRLWAHWAPRPSQNARGVQQHARVILQSQNYVVKIQLRCICAGAKNKMKGRPLGLFGRGESNPVCGPITLVLSSTQNARGI
jgi:hypothetical protein